MFIRFFLLSILLFYAPIYGNCTSYYTISFEDDPAHRIEIQSLGDWEKVENEGDTLHDMKFVKKHQNKSCLLFFGSLDSSSITTDDLCEAGEQILQEYYGNKRIQNHELSFNSNTYWNSFETVEGNELNYSAIVVYSIKNYLFGILVSNKSGKSALIEDCNFFIERIFLSTLQ